jgi:hypothetical protein
MSPETFAVRSLMDKRTHAELAAELNQVHRIAAEAWEAARRAYALASDVVVETELTTVMERLGTINAMAARTFQ